MPLSVAITLDTRRIKKLTGKYPVRLLVTHDSVPHRYQTIYELSKEEYNLLSSSRNSPIMQQIGSSLREIKQKAEEIALSIIPFDREEFEKEYISGNSLFYQRKYIKKSTTQNTEVEEFNYSPYFKRFPFLKEKLPNNRTIAHTAYLYIKDLIAQSRIGTAIAIHDSIKALLKFRGNVRFAQINTTWLYQYEGWATEKGLSKTTIGMYTRALRTLFNEAAARGFVDKEKFYPFGKRKYRIPHTRRRKKALTIEDVEKIYFYTPANEYENRAKDYWLFMYLCNGINPKDVALLKYENIEDGYLIFERAKTILTARSDPKTITVFITEDIQGIISRLGNANTSPGNYIFPILKDDMNPLQVHEAIKLFIAFVNNWMKEIGDSLNLPKKATTVISRHTFATVMKRAGASTEYIKEALGHHELKTTDIYMDSFEKEVKKEFSSKLTSFKSKPLPAAI